ncbi:MAG: hypothetical protein QW511_01565 [Candidatus Methanomethylicia archaeon]
MLSATRSVKVTNIPIDALEKIIDRQIGTKTVEVPRIIEHVNISVIFFIFRNLIEKTKPQKMISKGSTDVSKILNNIHALLPLNTI